MSIKRIAHKVYAVQADAARFAAWVDASLGLPSGSGRTRTTTHARVETHPSGTQWAYPITTVVAGLLAAERQRSRTPAELTAQPVLVDVRTVNEATPVFAQWARTP